MKNIVIATTLALSSIVSSAQKFDEAKKNDTGERIPMDEAFKMIEAKRKKNK